MPPSLPLPLLLLLSSSASFALGFVLSRSLSGSAWGSAAAGEGAGEGRRTGGGGGGGGDDGDADTAKRRSRGPAQGRKRGPGLALVGVGPGDAELVCLAAVREMAMAEVAVVDVLVPEEVVRRFIPAGCEVRRVNKRKGEAHAAQMELEEWTLEALRRGKRVVRVKGGDPFLFGRGGEEAARFTAMGYDVRVVPGVTSALCGPLAAGIPLTTRGFANQVVIATAHGKRDELTAVPAPYDASRTIVFLMSVSRVDLLVAQLLEAGYPPDVPAAVVEKATTPEQRCFSTTIAGLTSAVREGRVESPAIFVVGGTARGSGRADGVSASWRDGGVDLEVSSSSSS